MRLTAGGLGALAMAEGHTQRKRPPGGVSRWKPSWGSRQVSSQGTGHTEGTQRADVRAEGGQERRLSGEDVTESPSQFSSVTRPSRPQAGLNTFLNGETKLEAPSTSSGRTTTYSFSCPSPHTVLPPFTRPSSPPRI